MRKKRIISVLLAQTLMLSVLPVDIARAAVAEDFSIGDSEFGKQINKGYRYCYGNIFISPGDSVTLDSIFDEEWSKEHHITSYEWFKEDLDNFDIFTGSRLMQSQMESVGCDKKCYTVKPKKSTIYVRMTRTSEGESLFEVYVVNVSMGLTTSQNVEIYKGNPGEIANLSVEARLINPKGKVSYEWGCYSKDDNDEWKLEELPFASSKISVKIPQKSSSVVCVIKYTEEKFTQIERRYFCVGSYDYFEGITSLKGSDLVEVGENVSIYTKDASAVDWYNGDDDIVKSGVDTIKFDKPGIYYYHDKNTNNNGGNRVYVCRNGGNINLNKTVDGSVDNSIFESFYYTPSVSGEYNVEITNNSNVNLFVINKKCVFTSYDFFDMLSNYYLSLGNTTKNKNAKLSLNMTAGETYKIVVFMDKSMGPQQYQLKFSAGKNNCKHGSSFTIGEKAATLFTKGVTGEKRCGWCNEILKKGKTINKKTIKLSAKAIKKGAKLSWKKQTGIAGYQLRYATNKSFKKAKTVEVSKKSISKTLSKLTSKKKYYFAIRAYKKTGKKKVYSSWSKTVSIKVK